MMAIFRRGGRVVNTAVSAVSDTVEDAMTVNSPIHAIPIVTAEHPGSIGDDINLPLLVKELGGRKQATLRKRKDVLMKELQVIDKELAQLDVLVTAANSL